MWTPRAPFPILCSRPELVDFLLNCLLRNAFFGRSAVVRPGFCGHIFAKLGSRPKLVDSLLNGLLRNAFFGRSAVVRTFALAYSNFMQPTRTRRFPIKLFIKKRIFWSICGRPGLCGHIFAKWGSRPELVNFPLAFDMRAPGFFLTNYVFGPRILWELGRVVFSSQQLWVQRSKCCSFPEIGLTLNPKP